MSDLIDRQAAIDAVYKCTNIFISNLPVMVDKGDAYKALAALPSAQPTLYGYNIEHLAFVANALAKENIPPERLEEVLNNTGRIVAMVREEFENALRTVGARFAGK